MKRFEHLVEYLNASINFLQGISSYAISTADDFKFLYYQPLAIST